MWATSGRTIVLPFPDRHFTIYFKDAIASVKVPLPLDSSSPILVELAFISADGKYVIANNYNKLFIYDVARGDWSYVLINDLVGMPEISLMSVDLRRGNSSRLCFIIQPHSRKDDGEISNNYLGSYDFIQKNIIYFRELDKSQHPGLGHCSPDGLKQVVWVARSSTDISSYLITPNLTEIVEIDNTREFANKAAFSPNSDLLSFIFPDVRKIVSTETGQLLVADTAGAKQAINGFINSNNMLRSSEWWGIYSDAHLFSAIPPPLELWEKAYSSLRKNDQEKVDNERL